MNVRRKIKKFLAKRILYNQSASFDPDTMSAQKETAAFYLNGFFPKSFKTGERLDHLNEVIKTCVEGDLKPGFSWVEKYKGSRDLRPTVYEYDPVFIDVLHEANIAEILKQATGLDLTLMHVQLRVADRGNSYMDWHRDTHFYNGNLVGNVPPVVKIIFLPTLGAAPEARFAVVPRSHRFMPLDRVIDEAQTADWDQEAVESDDQRITIYDTSLFHTALPVTKCDKGVRLIYSFGRDFQLQGEGRELYRETNERYRKQAVAFE